MVQEPERNNDTSEVSRQYTTFRDLNRMITRGEATLKMIRDYGLTALSQLNLVNLLGADTVMVADVYNRSVREDDSENAQGYLARLGVQVENIEVIDAAEAHSLERLGEMAWNIPPNSQVELLTHRGRVVAVRLRSQGGENDVSE